MADCSFRRMFVLLEWLANPRCRRQLRDIFFFIETIPRVPYLTCLHSLGESA